MKAKKSNLIFYIIICVAFFSLTLVMFMQFKIVEQTDIELIEILREDELKEELANWKEKYEETEIKYQETLATIEEYEISSESQEETEILLKQELEEIDTSLGKNKVIGSGITVTLTDDVNSELPKVTSSDLLLIVNSLKLAGAEAISINDQRIISMTDIVDIRISIDELLIKVNGQRVEGPFVVKAIGDVAYLESALLGTGGHVNTMKKIGQDVVIERNEDLIILEYSEEYEIKYID